MSKIQILSSEVSGKIAAGEVIERPSYLVKELVENSLDSRATSIEVHFDDGGRRIRVRDNGEGIAKEDLELSLIRHATSKISSFHDLLSLSSFGFRGEALSSISSVSRLTVISHQKGSAKAYKIVSSFGSLSEVEEVGGDCGTLILVEDLFSKVPARLKFLKSAVAENQQIKNTLKALGLAHPNVDFRIRNKDKLLYFWPSSDDLSRVRSILEREDLYFNESESHGVRVKAFIGDPKKTLSHTRGLWFFVRNRWVQDKTIQAALLNAFDRLLMKKEYPVAAIFVECARDFFDVNIHPNKSQVKFQDSSPVFKAVFKTVRNILSKTPWLESVLQKGSSSTLKESEHKSLSRSFSDSSSYESPLNSSSVPSQSSQSIPSSSPLLHSSFDFSSESDSSSTQSNFTSTQFDPHSIKSDSNSTQFDSSSNDLSSLSPSSYKTPYKASYKVLPSSFNEIGSWSDLQIIGQAHLTYIILQSQKSIIFLDQHALHERIFYETYRKAWKSEKKFKTQNFLLPYDLKFEESQVEVLNSILPELKAFGIHADRMGPSHIVIRGAPQLFKPKSFHPLLELLAKEIEEQGESFAVEKMLGDIFATLACHSSIRAGQELNSVKIKALLQQMDEYPFSSFCPHGRPVYVEYPFQRLEKEFRRTL